MTHALASKWLGLSERMDFDNSQVPSDDFSDSIGRQPQFDAVAGLGKERGGDCRDH
jgi:hypothetical protein